MAIGLETSHKCQPYDVLSQVRKLPVSMCSGPCGEGRQGLPTHRGDCTEYWDLLHTLHWEFNNQRQEAGLLQTVHWDRGPVWFRWPVQPACCSHSQTSMTAQSSNEAQAVGILGCQTGHKERSQWYSKEAATWCNLSTTLIPKFYMLGYRDKGLSCQDDKSCMSQGSPERQKQNICVCVLFSFIWLAYMITMAIWILESQGSWSYCK